MPIKRRNAKARRELDELDMEDMFYGPGTCLINGCGYMGPHNDVLWRDATDPVKAEVLQAMRNDWDRQHRTIMAAWDGRGEHALWCADRHHGGPSEPWALCEFGPIDD